MIEWRHVEGKEKGDIKLYALSTCVWCKKTKKLLEELGVAYNCLDIDLLEDKEGDRVEEEEIKKWNPQGTYPTLVINNEKAIINFQEDEIRKALG